MFRIGPRDDVIYLVRLAYNLLKSIDYIRVLYYLLEELISCSKNIRVVIVAVKFTMHSLRLIEASLRK